MSIRVRASDVVGTTTPAGLTVVMTPSCAVCFPLMINALQSLHWYELFDSRWGERNARSTAS